MALPTERKLEITVTIDTIDITRIQIIPEGLNRTEMLTVWYDWGTESMKPDPQSTVEVPLPDIDYMVVLGSGTKIFTGQKLIDLKAAMLTGAHDELVPAIYDILNDAL